MILMDKGYFDYDFEKVEKPITWEDTVKSDEEVQSILSIFGMGQKEKPKTEEELQAYIIKEEGYGS